jgi:hypothetical protein
VERRFGKPIISGKSGHVKPMSEGCCRWIDSWGSTNKTIRPSPRHSSNLLWKYDHKAMVLWVVAESNGMLLMRKCAMPK